MRNAKPPRSRRATLTLSFWGRIPSSSTAGGSLANRAILALLCEEKQLREVWEETTTVQFRPLSDETISRYLGRVNVLDKAGAYAIQEYGDELVEHLDGEFENVIGLPLRRLSDRLPALLNG